MYNISSGNILGGVLYIVWGTNSVIYNGTTYMSGQVFRGVPSITNFTFSGSGTQLVYEVLELQGAALEFSENGLDQPIYSTTTTLNGFAIEYVQNANDISFNDKTILNAFSMELLDYPFYSFQITEKRL